MGTVAERKQFVEMVRKACHNGKVLREMGARPYGIVAKLRQLPQQWSADPVNNTVNC
jgi:hypothetical protein